VKCCSLLPFPSNVKSFHAVGDRQSQSWITELWPKVHSTRWWGSKQPQSLSYLLTNALLTAMCGSFWN
jgi:hypothetical protein